MIIYNAYITSLIHKPNNMFSYIKSMIKCFKLHQTVNKNAVHKLILYKNKAYSDNANI